MYLRLIVVCFLLLCTGLLPAQNDSISDKPPLKCRKIAVWSATGLLSSGSLFYLNQAWYANYSSGSFHFFNDNKQWLQMDKAGHVYTAYTLSRLLGNSYQWAGYSKNKSALMASAVSFAYLGGIETLDGFSQGWGFSWGDMAANTAGVAVYLAQENGWKEQRIWIKYAYHESDLAVYRPEVLGKNLSEKILKDYNAQIYWLSFNPLVVFGIKSKIPEFINLSFGYGATGMLTGLPDQALCFSDCGNNIPPLPCFFSPIRYRNYYLSMDIDFTRIKTKSKALKAIFTCLNTVKVPFPALMFSKYGTRFYYFR